LPPTVRGGPAEDVTQREPASIGSAHAHAESNALGCEIAVLASVMGAEPDFDL
jgi:hypothetical protein